MQQLPLPIALPETPSLARFVAGPNAAAVACLRELAEGRGERQVLLWSNGRYGKSYLLRALCAEMTGRGGAVDALALEGAGAGAPARLGALGQSGVALVALDDIQAITGEPAAEEALFHLVNRCRDAAIPLVMTARRAPAELGCRLPDLHSRLLWGPVFRLHPLDDADLARFLCARAAARGLDMPAEVANYLLLRCRRDPAHLQALVERLDHAALAHQRRLTVPLAREVLAAAQDDTGSR